MPLPHLALGREGEREGGQERSRARGKKKKKKKGENAKLNQFKKGINSLNGVVLPRIPQRLRRLITVQYGVNGTAIQRLGLNLPPAFWFLTRIILPHLPFLFSCS